MFFTCAIQRAHVLLCTAVLELVTRHYAYMVSGEYCKFSAFSTMVSRLALDHLTINYLNNRLFTAANIYKTSRKSTGS